MGRDALPPALGPRGEGWFALQVALLIALVLVAVLGPSWPEATWAPLAFIGAAAVGGGVFLSLAGFRRLGAALTPFPRPMAEQTLREHGIYRRVRHPIYGGVLLLAIGLTALTSPWCAVPTAALALLFDRKRRREEAWLAETYPGYEDYRHRVTRVFWPGVW
jgi:protein-S-isoprenylcysteine O-methyltransferase Ste14